MDNLIISRLARNRVFYEVYPIIGEENREIVVIGAGDAAFDYALGLAKKNRVTILNRHSGTKCLPLLEACCRADERIEYVTGIVVQRVDYIRGKLLLFCRREKDEIEIRSDFLVAAIGRKPNLDFLSERLTQHLEMLIAQKRLYMIGDVHNGTYRQAAIAVGEGIRCAMEICDEQRR
jgi:thioredoxin reductase